jgi:sRNA-binding protein
MSRHRIKGLLKEYTQSLAYCSAVKAGTPRIGLNGNVAGEVTLEDEQHALIRMARMARRAAAREARHAGRPPRRLKNTPNNRNRLPRQNLNCRHRLDHLVSVSQASKPPL